jgi:phospholipid/cholesterol/gamma-HCH transport system substrate-binding protein
MKLMIRFANQIVGAFIILAVGILIFVIFMLGSSQRWFSRDYVFRTYFTSASGLTQNMAVQFKGFTIGHVKSIELADDDRVEVKFTIFDTYIDRVKYGSVVELITSPIGGLGGGGLMFYPGLGDELVSEGDVIPATNSSEGKRFLAMGLADRPEQDDSISVIIQRVGTLLGTANNVLLELQDAFVGNDETTLGRTLGDLEGAVGGIRDLAETLPYDIEDVLGKLYEILNDFKGLSERLTAPDSAIMAILDSDGEVYPSLVASLDSLSGILLNLEKTTDFIPPQLPQVATLLNQALGALRVAEDVMVALTNNPLLKAGVPVHSETKVGGTHPRDIEF